MSMDKDRLLYIISVIIALSIFAPSAVILPTFEDKSAFTYQLLFFGFTLSAVVLVFFAANLVIDGFKRIYTILWIVIGLLRNRPKL